MSSATRPRLLVVDTAALSAPLELPGLTFRTARSVFPAVTCPVQASFRTATRPGEHGMVANGVFSRTLRKAMFWEQSAALVAGERIWAGLRRGGGKVAMLFWQQSLGEAVDIVLSPAPIHKHGGGMVDTCYARPEGLYERLCAAVGRRFKLRHYWGPLASPKAGEWIAQATAALLDDAELAPDLCLTYLPTLDYDLQRHDPAGPRAARAAAVLTAQLAGLVGSARQSGYEVLIFGDYSIRPVSGATFPNQALAQAGLLKTRPVAGMSYPDLYASRAFAVVDHQVAHVYCAEASDVATCRSVLSELLGVESVMDADAQRAAGIAHANSGDLVLEACPGTWFAYPWWSRGQAGPDYAGHIDIHNKPGYDPCELLLGWPPWLVSQDTARIRGSHGRAGDDSQVAWASTIEFDRTIGSIVDLAGATRAWLDEQ